MRYPLRFCKLDNIIIFTGGVALVYVGQPLDTVKVKMQTFPTIYKGMANCFLRTLRTDGIARGLYAGTIPAIAANVAENSVLFAAYGGCQKAIAYLLGAQNVKELSSFSNACAGFFAAFFSSLTLCPTELIKCKLQAMKEVEQMQTAANKSTVVSNDEFLIVNLWLVILNDIIVIHFLETSYRTVESDKTDF